MRTKVFTHVPADMPESRPCKIAFVGEAPSFEETLHGHPLVGPSGRLFNQMLRQAGIRREACLVTNVFDFQLGPKNDTAYVCYSKKERDDAAKQPDADPEWLAYGKLGDYGYIRPEFTADLHRLREEISSCQPNIIVPLGGTALWAFTGAAGIMEYRGSVGKANLLVPGTKLLPTLHPAHVIQDYRMLSVVVRDLVKAAAQAEFPEVRLKRRRLFIPETIADLEEFERKHIRAPGAGPLAFDIETYHGQIDCIGFAPTPEVAMTIPFVDKSKLNGSYWTTLDEEKAAWDWIERIMGDRSIEKLAQNGPYDIYWLLEKYGIKVYGYKWDTRLEHHALYPELPKSLLFLGSSYADAPAWKQMRGAKTGEKRDD